MSPVLTSNDSGQHSPVNCNLESEKLEMIGTGYMRPKPRTWRYPHQNTFGQWHNQAQLGG
jgi:hypothetical protein